VTGDEKLDALGTQVTDLRVLMAGVAGDTRTILGRLDAQDGRGQDHEARLREIERHGTATHERRIVAVELWRNRLIGAAAAAGVLGGGIGASISAALHLGH
jgi:predicted thioesterase